MHANRNWPGLFAATLFCLVGATLTPAASSAAGSRLAPLDGEARPVIERFLISQTAGMPGKVSITIDTPMSGALPACDAPEAFLPSGARLWGRVSVGVRCNAGQVGPSAWTRYVPAYVAIVGNYYVATRPIPAGEKLTPADIEVREGDLTTLPRSVITNPAQINGMIASNHIGSGAPLRAELLSGAIVVRYGQNVRLVAQGNGFVVSTEGKAVGNAAVGGAVAVKAQSGQQLSGIVGPDGTVEISN
ncbi:flagellar basal body P-ring formation chaperone FlgA [Glaciimonas sp. PAMC28666]|uniref:flagellar basal body P-ring formation chaperone FlgA n=1 Tax=Glaciimonas sp. PAMC28666 TaxID=2807626 RepID=UPI0019623998|nr:flagellar basal body P-ring formation chaperone FlgA [Glaciimonas sp. PAMC28666]QRX83138.1 flagellar basal body P-ring formation protein FlgA [Glaciimonas sp. PAMC28666]